MDLTNEKLHAIVKYMYRSGSIATLKSKEFKLAWKFPLSTQIKNNKFSHYAYILSKTVFVPLFLVKKTFAPFFFQKLLLAPIFVSPKTALNTVKETFMLSCESKWGFMIEKLGFLDSVEKTGKKTTSDSTHP